MNEINQLKSLMESITQLSESSAGRMKNADFVKMYPNLPLTWSIFVDTTSRTTSTNDVGESIVDLSTYAPDGTYDVFFNNALTDGIIVNDGVFVIKPTVDSIKAAVDAARYTGNSIEKLEWDPKV